MDAKDLFAVIEAGDHQLVAEILEADPEHCQARSDEGLSPIMVAAYSGQSEVLALLVRHCPALNFWEASIVGDVDRLRRLVNEDPSLVSERSPDGFTGLHFAAFFGNPDAVEALLDAGASVTARTTNVFANQPLHAAVAAPDVGNRVACVRLLLESGAPPSERAQGATPLMGAASNGDEALVELLLAGGVDPSLADDRGATAADYAARAGHTELAERLRQIDSPTV